jgi:cysteine desulfurase/selenocysteine lyase
MTTPTPISEVGRAQPANGILDEATLARLANEFFAALPGSGQPATSGIAALGRSEATSAPAVKTAAPISGSVPGVSAVSAPSGYAAALPRIGPLSEPLGAVPVAMPTHPYYFLAESSAFQSAPAGTPVPIAIAPASPPLSDTSLGPLPTEYPLPQARDSPGFYFLDPLQQRSLGAVPAAGLDAHPLFNVQAVIDRVAYFYAHENSNIHRAAHELAARATDAYERARSKVARFLGAASSDEIIFVRGATEGINLIAQSWGRANVGAGDEIVLSQLEHHANIVPWLQLAQEKGAKLRVIPVDDTGQILLEEYRNLLNDRTKLVTISQVSNALGTITPVAEIAELAHRAGARVLIDGAQAVSHLRVNVQALQADFYVFSGHKLFAPTGIGAVYGKSELLETMPPWQGGGNMIEDVTFERATYQKPPARFEAGTGNIGDAVGLGTAIDYVERLGLENIGRYEHDLLGYAMQGLQSVPGLRLIGTARDKASVQSFVLEGYRPEEVGSALNREGIAVRAGHHCAQPIVRRFGVEATVRPSFAFYNTCAEIDVLIRALHRLAHHIGRAKS